MFRRKITTKTNRVQAKSREIAPNLTGFKNLLRNLSGGSVTVKRISETGRSKPVGLNPGLNEINRSRINLPIKA
jgi:hypothetical protein